jgi:cysteine desulfurase family protein
MFYFNNAATSYPKPDIVNESVIKCLKQIPFHSARTGFERQEEDVIANCREKLSKLFNVPDPERIIFTSGSTESLNLSIRGIVKKNDHVITTAIEHNSVLRVVKTLERDGFIELTIVVCDETGYVNPQDIQKEIRSNTSVIVVNHCSNVTGRILDIKAISKIAREHGITIIVDVSQSAGSIPIDAANWDMDILAFTGHKSLLGLPGIGGMYIKKGVELKPLKVGGTGIRSDLLFQPEEFPLLFEAGTPNLPGIVSLDAGARYILETGIENIDKKKKYLISLLKNNLKDIPSIKIHGGDNGQFEPQILSININGQQPDEIGYVLENSFNIIVRSGLHCAPLIHKFLGTYPDGSVRISPSFFNTEKDVVYLSESIKKINRIMT